MEISTQSLSFETKGMTDILDITPQVEELLLASGLREGTATLFVPGATAGLSTIEFEPGLLKDLPEFFEEIAPYGRDWHHHKTWGDRNGASHIRAPLIGPSLVVPFVDGRLTLGTWQQIVLFDFDDRPRQRRVVCQLAGVK
ncbi:MAG: secondary thiamine-phosphate synthase enzyme YjbQ [Sumerlaeia bacterium]